MPEINNVVVYTSDLHDLILLKLGQIGGAFDHTGWSSDDLTAFRKCVRDFYRNEQAGKCAYCKNPVSLRSANNCHVEHIVPKSKHIEYIFEPKNLCVICADCNEIKRSQETLNEIEDTLTLSRGRVRQRYPSVSTGFKIVHPHFDNYKDHILIFGDFYVDKTRKGNFTIGVCDLNRKLHEFGWAEAFHSDADIAVLMTEFLESTDSIRRKKVLKELTNILIKLEQE